MRDKVHIFIQICSCIGEWPKRAFAKLENELLSYYFLLPLDHQWKRWRVAWKIRVHLSKSEASCSLNLIHKRGAVREIRVAESFVCFIHLSSFAVKHIKRGTEQRSTSNMTRIHVIDGNVSAYVIRDEDKWTVIVTNQRPTASEPRNKENYFQYGTIADNSRPICFGPSK